MKGSKLKSILVIIACVLFIGGSVKTMYNEYKDKDATPAVETQTAQYQVIEA